MRGWIASRLLQTVLVIFLSLTAVFGMVRLSGDPVLLFMPMDIQAKDVNEYRERLGFNDPLLVQYARFMRGAVRGDFGESLRYRRDALGLVLERLPATLLLAGAALVLAPAPPGPPGAAPPARPGAAGGHAGGARGRPAAGRRRRDRDDLRVAGPRAAHRAGAAEPRLPRGDGRGVVHVDRLHAHEPGRGPALRLARPARETAVMKKYLGLALTLAVVVAAVGAPCLAATVPMTTHFANGLH